LRFGQFYQTNQTYQIGQEFKVCPNLGHSGKSQPIKTNYLGKPWRPGADNGPVSIKVELEIQILLTKAFSFADNGQYEEHASHLGKPTANPAYTRGEQITSVTYKTSRSPKQNKKTHTCPFH
jgi:hypothetical protein